MKDHRILVALAEEDGTVLERFILIFHTSGSIGWAAASVRDFIEQKFDTEEA